MANGTAPVCPVSRNQVPAGMPPTRTPQIPLATDLSSAIAALAQIIATTHPTQVSSNNVAPTKSTAVAGTTGSTGGAGTKKQPGWEEIGRNLEKHRIHNPDDGSVFVELNRITYLLFQERKTQVTLEWNLGYGQID